MKPSLRGKLETLSERLQELNALLSDSSIISNQEKFRTLSIEHAQLSPVVSCFQRYQHTLTDINTAREMLQDKTADKDAREFLKKRMDAAEMVRQLRVG